MEKDLSIKGIRTVIYITLIGLAILIFMMGIAFSLKMKNGEGIMENVMPLIVSLGFINYWYFKSEKFFVDPYEKYDLKDHIIKNGNKYKGNVVHIAEKFIVENNRKKLDSTVVIEFFKDGEKKHILLEHFPYMIRVFDVSERPVTEKNYLNLTQYTTKEGAISFERLGDELEESYFDGIIETNFEGILNCNVFEYRGRYIIDNIPGYELDKDGFNVKNDIVGYKIFSFKVLAVFCLLTKIYSYFM